MSRWAAGIVHFSGTKHIEAEVGIGAIIDTAAQFFLRNASAASQQFASAIAAIGVDSHAIGLGGVERATVGHAEDADTLADGLGDIDLVADAGGGVEVVVDVLEFRTSLACVLVAVVRRSLITEDEMVVG